jgi:hypothetical protein
MSDDEVTICHGGAKPGDNNFADVVAVRRDHRSRSA